MKVLIAGGGKVGSFLASILAKNNEVVMVDKATDKCALLRTELGNVPVICEDACEPWVLEMGKISEKDLVLAVTGDDEDNLVISFLAKFEYDVPKVIARVNNPLNRWLFTKNWGVDVEVSAPDIIARIIEEETTLGEVVTLMKLQASDVGLIEITIPGDSLVLNQTLADLKLPPDTLIVTVVRGEAMMIPSADTTLMANDRVLAITRAEGDKQLQQLLGHKPH
jgi:trk system potassium uptake protein TrkA